MSGFQFEQQNSLNTWGNDGVGFQNIGLYVNSFGDHESSMGGGGGVFRFPSKHPHFSWYIFWYLHPTAQNELKCITWKTVQC